MGFAGKKASQEFEVIVFLLGHTDIACIYAGEPLQSKYSS